VILSFDLRRPCKLFFRVISIKKKNFGLHFTFFYSLHQICLINILPCGITFCGVTKTEKKLIITLFTEFLFF